ncbi:nucleotide sugar epimerase [Thermosipho sp. 1063]|uniref:NAD-dependent epimerase/dehydratase family protein n=1 Tax=Thermosipho sp. 1063 TaxID=1462747 RepID=UPI00095057F9|nr:NAD-dependent epimerase/dehydratase family protein [Thermosipho sp. 1063]APT72101.1 nucleotide sugar epimerase [Thermosipho sp. 1063]
MTYLDYYNGKKILVTGGAGAVGSNLVKKLLELGAFVIVIDNLSSGYTWLLPDDAPNLLFVHGDITNDIDLKRVFNEEPEIVFHLAAFFANQNSVDYPEKDLMTNGFGTLKLLEYAKIYGKVERFIYASSGCSIYPSDAPMPYKENLPPSMWMSTPYQITKMLGELYGNYFLKMYNIPFTKARFFNSFGPGEVPGQYRNVIPNFIYWALSGKPLPITGTGEETRDFTYVGDIVDGLLRMGYYKEAIGEAFNLAAGREIKIKYLAEKVNELTGNKAGIIFKERRKWDTKPTLLASNEKAKKLLEFNPDPDFDKRLAETVEWFKENWENIKKFAQFGPGVSSAVR